MASSEPVEETDQEVGTEAQGHQEEAVDALEERVFGAPEDQSREQQTGPAFEQDLDDDEFGTAAAGAEQPE